MQTILSVFVLLVAPGTVFSYPVFGTKRYQRASYQPIPFQPYQQQPLYDDPYSSYRQAGLGVAAAAAVPSAVQSYPDYTDTSGAFYYPQQQQLHNERYTSFGLPTYHGDYKTTPYYYSRGPIFGYNDDRDNTPMDDVHDELMQEDEYDRTRDSYPMGQEVWFEPPGRGQESLAKVNAAFLRNLMLYNSQFGRPNVQFPTGLDSSSSAGAQIGSGSHFNEYDYDDVPMNPNWFDSPSGTPTGAIGDTFRLSPLSYDDMIKPASLSKSGAYSSRLSPTNNNLVKDDDQDVKELRALVNQHRKEHDSMYSQQDIRQSLQPNPVMGSMGQDYENADLDSEYDDSWINWDNKRSTQPKKATNFKGDNHKKETAVSSMSTSTVAPKLTAATTTKHTTLEGKITTTKGEQHHGGQKEIVLPRPATPVRHPFRSTVFNNLDYTPQEDKKAKLPHSSGAIYDTIKQMLTMEQQLEAVS